MWQKSKKLNEKYAKIMKRHISEESLNDQKKSFAF